MATTKHSLLLVEDSQDDEALALRAIAHSGVPCDVKVIRHGGEALALLLNDTGPPPTLIVLDFHLPGFNGLEILRELRKHERTKRLPIVMLSSLENESEIKDCLNSGASSFVPKPMDAQAYTDNIALIIRYWLTVDKRPD